MKENFCFMSGPGIEFQSKTFSVKIELQFQKFGNKTLIKFDNIFFCHQYSGIFLIQMKIFHSDYSHQILCYILSKVNLLGNIWREY